MEGPPLAGGTAAGLMDRRQAAAAIHRGKAPFEHQSLVGMVKPLVETDGQTDGQNFTTPVVNTDGQNPMVKTRGRNPMVKTHVGSRM
jgi:hypothetical protein